MMLSPLNRGTRHADFTYQFVDAPLLIGSDHTTRATGFGNSGYTNSAQPAATSQTTPQDPIASRCGMHSGVRKKPKYTAVFAIPSAVPARSLPAIVASSV